MSKTTRSKGRKMSTDANPGPTKQARLGVGSSVSKPLQAFPQDQFLKTLVYTKAHRLLPRGKVIRATRRMENVMAMWQNLVTHNLQSLVVLNEDSTYHGMVDYSDIVRYVIKLFDDDTSTTTSMDLERIFEQEKVLSETAVHQIMPYPRDKGNIFHPAHVGSSLFSCMEKLYLLGNHRIPIIDGDFQLKDIITQSMCIDFLYQNVDQIGTLQSSKLSDLPNFYTHSVSITGEDSKAIDCFKTMIDQNVTGLAIVDSDGKLVDNLSLRDLKTVRPDVKVFWRLYAPVKTFKKHCRAEFPSHNIPGDVIVATKEDNLGFVIEMMAVKHLHHLFIVDSRETMKPTGVISQTDVIKGIMMKPSNGKPSTTAV